MAMFSQSLTTLQSISPPPSSSSMTHARPQFPAYMPPQDKLQAPSHTTEAVEMLIDMNDLSCYCQRLGRQLPAYSTIVEGFPQATNFRSTVWLGTQKFTSPNTFADEKSAEQAVVKLALEHLLTEDEANALYLRKLVCQDKSRCKTIINEFTSKMKIKSAYETFQIERPPLFGSSLALNGTCYKGEAGKSKREAEQLAALAAILSLLDDPTYTKPVAQVIKSKFNVGATFGEAKDFPKTRVIGNELKTKQGGAGLPTEGVTTYRRSYRNLGPITPALDLVDIPSSSKKRRKQET